MPNFRTGAWAECLAEQFLQKQGFKIVARNIRLGNHEVDLVAEDGASQELVFIEVKSRASGWYGDPSQAVNQAKLWSMRYVAGAYRRQNHHRGDFRFDVVTVVEERLEHYRNVTWNRCR